MRTRVVMDSKEEHVVDSKDFPSDAMLSVADVIRYCDERTVLKTEVGGYIVVSKIESFKEV